MSTPQYKPLVVDVYDGPNLMLDADQIQFSGKSSQRFAIYNTGGKTLHIDDIVSDCQLVDVAYTGNDIKSAGHKWVELRHRLVQAPGEERCTLRIDSNDPDTPETRLAILTN